MQGVGQLLLHVAFFATLLTAAAAFYAAATRNAALMRGVRYGMAATLMLYFAMAAVLWHGLYTHDYGNKYIATYTDTEMPLVYLFTSFWGGEKGALLFWTTILTLFSTIAVHQARHKDTAYLGCAAGILMMAVFFFDILMVFETSPFDVFLSHDGPSDGDGLNPLLQNPTMAVHPPSLLTGYIAFTVPFAFGAAALITGRLGDEWAKETRKWTIVSWLFLTVGLILGGYWAYHELGWGGFWMWDPVENAGLIPWFTATAFLHSIIVQERRGMLRRWNFTLVCLTFILTIFGTFLTRSQLIVSIHAFADSALSEYFLIYMAVIAVLSFGLLVWRWGALKAKDRINNFLSKEAFFVLNNVVLVMCAFIVMWGTLYSKISGTRWFQGDTLVVAGWDAIRLMNISDPTDPTLVARELFTPTEIVDGRVLSVETLGDGFVAAGNNHITVLETQLDAVSPEFNPHQRVVSIEVLEGNDGGSTGLLFYNTGKVPLVMTNLQSSDERILLCDDECGQTVPEMVADADGVTFLEIQTTSGESIVAEITLETNDPDEPAVTIPVRVNPTLLEAENVAPDFVMPGVYGELIQLSQLKGTVVYLKLFNSL